MTKPSSRPPPRPSYRPTTLAKRTLELASSLLEAPEQVLLDIARELKLEDSPASKVAACILECAARGQASHANFTPEPPPTQPELDPLGSGTPPSDVAPTQAELDGMPTSSIGTCRFCGYYGPGPRHTCPRASP